MSTTHQCSILHNRTTADNSQLAYALTKLETRAMMEHLCGIFSTQAETLARVRTDPAHLLPACSFRPEG